MIPVDEALARILAGLRPLEAETVPVDQASGRCLARPMVARRTQPALPVSAMDGYAVRAEDTGTAPSRLTLIGTVAAGSRFEGRVGPGEAVRLFTGAAVPEGADTVVAQEDVREDGGQAEIGIDTEKGRHVRPAGLDFKDGDRLIEAGTRLGPAHVALAAAAGYGTLEVVRRPRVALLATGDELTRAGEPTGPAQTVASSLYGLMACVRDWGAEPIDLGIAPDRMEALRAAIARAGNADILVTMGGASVGDHDLVQDALRGESFAIDFWKIAMRPGKPLMFGSRPRSGAPALPVLGLPGNPVSSLVCAQLFLKPALAAFQGAADTAHQTIEATSATDLPANGQRADYMRATLERSKDGTLVARAFARQDSAMLSLYASAGALLLRPAHAPALKAGAPVPVILLRPLA